MTAKETKKKEEEFKKQLERDFLEYGAKAIEQMNKWFFEVAAFASGVIIVACTILGDTESPIIKPMLYISMTLAVCVILHTLWLMKHRAESDLNALPKQRKEYLELLRDPVDLEDYKSKLRKIEQLKKEAPNKKSYSSDIVMVELTLSLLFFLMAVAGKPLCSSLHTLISLNLFC